MGKMLKIKRTLLYTIGRPLDWLLFHTVFPFRVVNANALRGREAPYLLIANHRHALDPALLGMLCPYEIRFLGKEELVRSRAARWLLSKLHMIPIARHESDLNAIRTCITTLREGNVLTIFPEGTRHQEKLMGTVEKGTALLALREKVDMIPVYIDGIMKPFRLNRAIVGDPILASDYPAGGYNSRNAEILCSRIRDSFYALRDRLKGDSVDRTRR